jgi:hypothetical protein
MAIAVAIRVGIKNLKITGGDSVASSRDTRPKHF